MESRTTTAAGTSSTASDIRATTVATVATVDAFGIAAADESAPSSGAEMGSTLGERSSGRVVDPLANAATGRGNSSVAT